MCTLYLSKNHSHIHVSDILGGSGSVHVVMYPMSYKLVYAVLLSNDSLYLFVLVYIS